MQSVKKQYNYFESLESKIKTALSIYLVFFITGMILTILGAQNVFVFLQTHQLIYSTIAGVFVLATYFGLVFVIGKVNWLGDLHITLDRRFFGFLEKSNETIFQTLISVLAPHERKQFHSLPADKKGTITQSIFTNLSDDNNYLFDKLMSSGIFHNWIWYWVTIYGTFTFTLLTLCSFVVVWIQDEVFSKPFFTFNWILALVHLFVSIMIGKFLVEKTRKTVQVIVDVHQMEIANVLITRIHDEPNEVENEMFRYQDSDT